MPLPFEWFNYNVLKNFAAVEIKGETRIKTQTIPSRQANGKTKCVAQTVTCLSCVVIFPVDTRHGD